MKGHLDVQVTSPFARFGFTVASIGDINGDGYEDIAVGAPLEDQLSDSSSFGSIYIFNGDKDKIKSSFSQVRDLLGIACTTPQEGKACGFVARGWEEGLPCFICIDGWEVCRCQRVYVTPQISAAELLLNCNYSPVCLGKGTGFRCCL